ncbi:MAG TPA: LacI family DNA-binding transcriptional regulator [Reyranella sp.]|nr:LacI family DNA-binding transcriptional regulator [Reyranella sp.]
MNGATLPTIREVARLAGVSVATVSKALNDSGRVSEALRERVKAAARTLGYAPHASARSLRSGTTRILGLLVADITNPFFLKLVEHIEQLASTAGYSVILCNSGEDAEREQRHLKMLLSQRVDGILLIPVRDGWKGRVGALSRLPQPLVLVDRMLDGVEAASVTIDNGMAGRLAGEHLFQLGHRRVGVVMGSPEHQIARHRLDGFREAFATNDFALNEQLIARNCFNEEAAYRAVLSLLDRDERPTAVFATNNHLALGLLRAVMDRGLAIPEALSVVAFDDLPFASIMRPGLTVVVQPSAAIAEAAVSGLLGRIAGRTAENDTQAVVLTPRLVVRGSTATL